MGRRSATKKTQVRSAEQNNGDDVLLRDMLLADQHQIITVEQNGTADTVDGLTDVAIIEEDSPSPTSKHRNSNEKAQLTEVAVLELDRSMELVKSTRKSMRLLGAPVDDVGTQSGSGTVEVAVEGAQASDAEQEHDISQGLQVKETESREIQRLFKIVEEQQLRINELASEKSLTRKEETSLAEVGPKGESSKYKLKYEDAKKKIRGLEQNENELIRKFENANSKLEGYEQGQRNIYNIIDKLKEAAYFQSLSLPSSSKGRRTPKPSVHTKRQPAKKKKVTDIGEPEPPKAPKTRSATKRKRV